MVVEVGTQAPDFNVPSSADKNISLKDFKGKKVVLYFYPKDDTPGCTVEACNFRDNSKQIEKLGAVVLGVSPDSVKKHGKFIEKFNLPFILLSDEDHKLSESYNVWVEKSMYGRKYMGIERSTFIIDENGKIQHIFRKVDPKTHHEDVLAVLQSK